MIKREHRAESGHSPASDRFWSQGQLGAHVRGYGLVAVCGVNEKAVAIRHRAGEEGLEIAPDVWVGDFLDEERGQIEF